MDRTIKEIRELRAEGKQQSFIMKKLDIQSRTTYFHYIHLIQEEDKKNIAAKRDKLFPYEVSLTSVLLEKIIDESLEIARNSGIESKDRLEAYKLAKDTAVEKIRLIRDGTTDSPVNETGSDSQPEEAHVSDEFIKFAEHVAKLQTSSTYG